MGHIISFFGTNIISLYKNPLTGGLSKTYETDCAERPVINYGRGATKLERAGQVFSPYIFTPNRDTNLTPVGVGKLNFKYSRSSIIPTNGEWGKIVIPKRGRSTKWFEVVLAIVNGGRRKKKKNLKRWAMGGHP